MNNTNHQTLIWIGAGLIAATIFVIAISLPHDVFHGWWIFGYTEHVVPASYLIATAWLIALISLAFFVRWYAKQQTKQADHNPIDWHLIATAVLAGGIIAASGR